MRSTPLPARPIAALAVVAAVTALALSSCRSTDAEAAPATASSGVAAVAVANRPAGWDDYWYAGEAEISTYDLTQNRYGEDRDGDAVLVFVTEGFLPGAQVKDDGQPADEEAVSVLKLNRIHRFNTGIYDYSLMESVFTPVSRDRYPHTLKTTLSAQDWCGHSWFQLNRRGGAFEAERRSYFQAEADAKRRLSADLLEDELASLVRIDADLVPTGETRLIPGAMFSALYHVMPEPQDAVIGFRESAGERVLTVDYPGLDRQLELRFAAAFPHEVLGWTETYKGQRLSAAELRHTRKGAYWGQNATRFAPLRDSLGL